MLLILFLLVYAMYLRDIQRKGTSGSYVCGMYVVAVNIHCLYITYFLMQSCTILRNVC